MNAGTIKVVEEIIYLDGEVKSQNDVSSEILRRIPVANKCYYGLSKQLPYVGRENSPCIGRLSYQCSCMAQKHG